MRGVTTASQVALGGKRIALWQLRARSKSKGGMTLRSFESTAGGRPLHAATMVAIAAGASTRC